VSGGKVEKLSIEKINICYWEVRMKHLLSVLVMVIIICASAKAEEVTFTFKGTVHELDTEFSYFGGRPFEITYSFERKTEAANSGESESDRYVGAIKSGSLTLFADSKTYHWAILPDGPGNIIEVKHLKNAVTYSASASISGKESGNEIPAVFSVELIDDSATALGNDAFPSSLKLKSFFLKFVRFTFTGSLQHSYSAFGVITSGNTPALQ
jgi:hypothetical protein